MSHADRIEAKPFDTPPIDAIASPDVRGRLEDYHRFRELVRDAVEAVAAAERDLSAAQEAEIRDRAEALRSNTSPPTSKSVERAHKALEEARRNVAVVEEATRQALEALRGEILAQRPAWLHEVAVSEEKARVAFVDALARLESARDELRKAQSLSDWLREFPAGRYFPGRFVARAPALVGLNGDPLSLDVVIAGLHEVAAPKPRVESDAEPLLEAAA